MSNSKITCAICDKSLTTSFLHDEKIAEIGPWTLAHINSAPQGLPTKGHLMIESNRHICDYSEMSEDEAKHLGIAIQHGSRLLKQHVAAQHVYLFRINDLVAHLHFHLIPRYADTPKEFWGTSIRDWPGRPVVDRVQMATLVAILKSSAEHIFDK
jgi:histidine triad (HIT) family protein